MWEPSLPAHNQWYMWVVFLCALLRLIFTFGYMWIHEITHEAKDHNLFVFIASWNLRCKWFFNSNFSTCRVSAFPKYARWIISIVQGLNMSWHNSRKILATEIIPKYFLRKEKEKISGKWWALNHFNFLFDWLNHNILGAVFLSFSFGKENILWSAYIFGTN